MRLGADRRGTRRRHRRDGNEARPRHGDRDVRVRSARSRQIATGSRSVPVRPHPAPRGLATPGDGRGGAASTAARPLPTGDPPCVAVACVPARPSDGGSARAAPSRSRWCWSGTGGCAKKPATLPSVPGAPRFADFVFPAGASGAGRPRPSGIAIGRRVALLQAGDARAADRGFSARSQGIARVLSRRPRASATRRWRGRTRPRRAGALRSRAEREPDLCAGARRQGRSAAGLGRHDAALEAFQAALAADPALTSLRSRVDVLKFRGVQQHIESARKAAEAGKAEDARTRVPGGDCRLARERVSLSRAGGGRAQGRRRRHPRWCTPNRR